VWSFSVGILRPRGPFLFGCIFFPRRARFPRFCHFGFLWNTAVTQSQSSVMMAASLAAEHFGVARRAPCALRLWRE
jgi:hypothetical protein